MKRWFKIDFNDVFFNGLTTAQIGCVVKYKCICQQCEIDVLSDEQLKANFDSRERQFLIKFFKIESKVNQEFVQSKSKVNQKFVQNESKVCSEKERKNNDFPIIYNNNIYNKEKKREEREEREEKNSANAPNKKYAFEGKIIKLKQEDFEKWKQAYPDLNLNAELLQRDLWLEEQPPEVQKRWFLSTSQYFIKQNERRKVQHDEFISNDNATEERFYL